jgi:hypothetical protein
VAARRGAGGQDLFEIGGGGGGHGGFPFLGTVSGGQRQGVQV